MTPLSLLQIPGTTGVPGAGKNGGTDRLFVAAWTTHQTNPLGINDFVFRSGWQLLVRRGDGGFVATRLVWCAA